jgi:hypothetical protein
LSRVLRGAKFFLFLVAGAASCASAPPQYPYRACLFDRDGRGLFTTGSVVAQDADFRLRFRYDDPGWGDHDDKGDPRHGFIWVDQGDAQRSVRPCQAASPFGDIDASRPGAMPATATQ